MVDNAPGARADTRTHERATAQQHHPNWQKASRAASSNAFHCVTIEPRHRVWELATRQLFPLSASPSQLHPVFEEGDYGIPPAPEPVAPNPRPLQPCVVWRARPRTDCRSTAIRRTNSSHSQWGMEVAPRRGAGTQRTTSTEQRGLPHAHAACPRPSRLTALPAHARASAPIGAPRLHTRSA